MATVGASSLGHVKLLMRAAGVFWSALNMRQLVQLPR